MMSEGRAACWIVAKAGEASAREPHRAQSPHGALIYVPPASCDTCPSVRDTQFLPTIFIFYFGAK